MLFEIKTVPDVSWQTDYKYDSKDPHGGWLFKESIVEAYGKANVLYYDDLDSLPNDSNYLYINYGPNIIVPQKKQNQLLSFSENNNSILFICNDIDTYDKTLGLFYTMNYYDSLTQIQFHDLDSISFKFQYYKNKIDKISHEFHSAVYPVDFVDSTYHSIAFSQDTLSVFVKKQHENGDIHYYFNPYNFSNIASKQADYLQHFNKVFSHFDATKIILDNPKKSDILQSKYSDTSPIQYILSQTSLAWAYYLTLVSLLIFIFFRGKRKQRIIPISKANKNTSLEYVDTVSQLFQSQKQNRKLVEHIENIFYHKVRNKYFIDKTHTDFINTFSHKSKIKRTDVDHIIDVFKNAKDGYDFTDDQLHRLHKKLEIIYTNWK